MSINITFPYQFDSHGRTAVSDIDSHIRELLMMLLMTNPGERVNRPDFGGGLAGMVFAGNRPDLQNTLKFLCQGAIVKYLGHLIDLRNLEVTPNDETLTVQVTYTPLLTNNVKTLSIQLQP